MKHRALIIGAGRIGAGYNWPGFPYCYVHADAYLALKDRVELVGFVESDPLRGAAAVTKYKLPAFGTIESAMYHTKPNIVSICTPDDTHQNVFEQCIGSGFYGDGYFVEKPFPFYEGWKTPIQVNYCRRFDKMHQAVAERVKGRKSHLFVWAREDVTTKCHFEDLARWWGSELIYMDNTGESPSTNSYRLECGKWAVDFRNGGVEGDFMIDALSNLLDVVDGVPGAVLLSPPYVESK